MYECVCLFGGTESEVEREFFLFDDRTQNYRPRIIKIAANEKVNKIHEMSSKICKVDYFFVDGLIMQGRLYFSHSNIFFHIRYVICVLFWPLAIFCSDFPTLYMDISSFDASRRVGSFFWLQGEGQAKFSLLFEGRLKRSRIELIITFFRMRTKRTFFKSDFDVIIRLEKFKEN